MVENPNLNTQEKIVNHMKSLLGEKQLNGKTPEKQNMAVYDVLLLNKAANGVWDRVTDENFPAAGVTVTIPYPEGTNASDYAFLAMHMLTMSRTGSDGKQYRAGDVEIPSLTLTDDGIEMTLNSLSPIALSWAKIDSLQRIRMIRIKMTRIRIIRTHRLPQEIRTRTIRILRTQQRIRRILPRRNINIPKVLLRLLNPQ